MNSRPMFVNNAWIYNPLDSFIEPLTFIINFSLHSGVFPSELELARVVPIFEASDSSALTNYRPISVLTFFLLRCLKKSFITKFLISFLIIMFYMIINMVFVKVVQLSMPLLFLLTRLPNPKIWGI